MVEHDLEAVAFPAHRSADASSGTAPAPRSGAIRMGIGSSRPAIAISSSSSSAPARSIVDESGETPKTVTSMDPGSSRRRVAPDRPAGGGQRRRPGDCEVYEVSSATLRQILGQSPDLADVILQAFIARRQLLRESETSRPRVLGSRYSKDTFRVRDFLAATACSSPGST